MLADTIKVDRLTVVRDRTRVLDEVSFAISAGRLTGLIGPSGSGKTTLMRAIMGAQKVSSGTLEVLGRSAGDKQLRSKIGYVTQSPAVYGDLTTRQNLLYFAAILGVPKSEVARVIKQVDLGPQSSQLVNTLSGGQRARVSLAIALLGDVQLLILDEPTVGLDPLLRIHLWGLFKELALENKTLLISSHVMDEAERCDDVLLLREGKVLNYSTKHALLRQTGTDSVEAAFLKLITEGRN